MSVKAIATFHGLKDILNVCITKDSLWNLTQNFIVP